jgi:SAM-dependent methyltransferase
MGELAGEKVLNVDRVAMVGVDEVVDLNIVPWPWPDGSFSNILALDIIEHLDNIMLVMDECWRVLAIGGRMQIRTTNWQTSQSYTDPTHKHWFNLESFDFLDPATRWGRDDAWYTVRKWRKVDAKPDGNELTFTLEVRK